MYNAMNKKNPLIYSIVLITILVSNVLSAQSIDSTLQRAKILYDTQQYDSVIVLYNQLISSGNVSDKLYFNLANAYYKQREIAQAILWYERALVLDPYNDDIRNNLRIAQASQPDKVEQIQESLFQIWYPYVYRVFSSNTWAVMSIICFVTAIISVLWFLFSNIRLNKKISFFGALFLAGIALFSYSNAKYRYKELTQNSYAIVMEPSLSILTEPKQHSKELVVVHGGLKVYIEKASGEWLSIRLPDGKVGWVQHFAIQRI